MFVARVRWAVVEPTSVERAGSRPYVLANASGSPGSGGRHQQTGGPASVRADGGRDGAGHDRAKPRQVVRDVVG